MYYVLPSALQISITQWQSNNLDIFSAIVHVAERLCGRTLRAPTATSPEDAWKALHDLIADEMPVQLAIHMPLRTRQMTVLSAMLSYAVSESCIGRNANIARILAMSRELQPKLVKHIERAKMHSSEPRRTSCSGRARSRDEAFGSPDAGFTPQRKKNALGRMAVERFFSPGTIDAAMDTMVDDLRRQNQDLQLDLEHSQKRESDLSSKIHDMMKLESAALRRAEELRADHEAEIFRLQNELEGLQETKIREEIARHELESMRDEMDLLEHNTEKLAETEEKFRKCRERLEQLGDVKEALKREEEAHSVSVSECLRLENELKALQPLRRQLEDYKTRAIDAEVRLAECQKDLKRLTNISQHLSSAHKKLLKGAKVHNDVANELRKRLYDDEATHEEHSAATLGEGISELNPKVKEELERLRNENAQLKEFAAKREDDAVQLLEEKLDDATRLSDKFKEQYFSTKGDLEITRSELRISMEQEAHLRVAVEEWTSKWTQLDKLLHETTASLDQLKLDLEGTERMLEESKGREIGLVEDLQKWKDTAEVAQGLAESRSVEIAETKRELNDILNSFLASQEREKLLNADVDDWVGKFTVLQDTHSVLQQSHDATCESLKVKLAELNEAKSREELLREDKANLLGEKNLMEELLKAEKLSKDEAIIASKDHLDRTCEQLKEKGRKDLLDLHERMNALLEQERQANRNHLIKAATEYKELVQTSTEAMNEKQKQIDAMLTSIREGHVSEVTTLKDQYEEEIESLKKQAANDRESLIEKGKAMLRKTKSKAEAEINEIEDELSRSKELLSQQEKEYAEYQEKTLAKIASYKHQLLFATSRMTELTTENDDMHEKMNTLEREKFTVLEENDRFRRQLGGRYGADGKTQNQLETLQKEFNAILDENRELKKAIVKRSTLAAISEASFEPTGPTPYSSTGVSGSTLTQLREEYEEQIQALNDEKRELVMRNSAAITDVQKAEQRSWELEKELARLKDELTSTKLAVQRAERFVEESSMVNDESFQEVDENMYEPRMILDTSSVAPSVDVRPAPFQNSAIHTPTNRKGVKQVLADSGSQPVVTATFDTSLSVPIKPHVPASAVRQLPSLMDMTQMGEIPGGGQSECKQS